MTATKIAVTCAFLRGEDQGYLAALQDVEHDLRQGLQHAEQQRAEMERRSDEMRAGVIAGHGDGEAYFEVMQERAAMMGVKAGLQKALDHLAIFRTRWTEQEDARDADIQGGSDEHR